MLKTHSLSFDLFKGWIPSAPLGPSLSSTVFVEFAEAARASLGECRHMWGWLASADRDIVAHGHSAGTHGWSGFCSGKECVGSEEECNLSGSVLSARWTAESGVIQVHSVARGNGSASPAAGPDDVDSVSGEAEAGCGLLRIRSLSHVSPCCSSGNSCLPWQTGCICINCRAALLSLNANIRMIT